MIANLQLMQYHCVMHQQNVCAKPASLQNVMKVIVKILNFVRPNVLKHREFQTCLSEPELEYGE
ncbi:hypothetical protein Cfor_11228, partial [Coptotermes formosanus]